MRHLRFWLLLSLILSLSVTVTAQDTTVPAPVATPDEIQENSVRAEEAAARAEEAAEQAQEARSAANDAVGQAFNLLGLFEAIGFLVTVVGGAAALFGVRGLNAARDQLEEARKQFIDELEAARERLAEETRQKEADFEALRQELKRDTDNATLALSYLPLGESQYKSGNFVGALDIYERALSLDGNNPIIHYRLGYVYTQSGRLDEAQDHLEKALRIDKDFAQALAVLGYTYRRKAEKMEVGIERDKLLNRAEYMLQQALTLAPRLVDDDGESWWGSLGGLYRRRGQIDQAIYAYSRAAEIDPNSSYAFSNLALLYMQRNEAVKMIDTYRQVEKLAQAETLAELDNYWAFNDLLTSRLALRKFNEADTTLQAVLTTAPIDSPYVLESLVDTLSRLAKVLDSDHAERVQSYIARIEAHAQEQAQARAKAAAESTIEAPAS